jgi:hypothetical protein
MIRSPPTRTDILVRVAIRARRVSRRFSGVFIRGFPPNKKTTRQRIKTGGLCITRSGFNHFEFGLSTGREQARNRLESRLVNSCY